MVAIVILRQDENGDLYDQDGHLRNATSQKLDAQGNVIPDADATGASQLLGSKTVTTELPPENPQRSYFRKS